jgi:hypothetical protein
MGSASFSSFLAQPDVMSMHAAVSNSVVLVFCMG